MKILVLILILLLTSCSSADPVEACIEVVEDYYDSLVTRNLDGQLEILEAFSLDGEDYWENFLSYVKGGHSQEIRLQHENELLIMIKLEFVLELEEDFPPNASFQPGSNRVQRYFSFFKNDNYRLKEILNKAIY